MANDAPPLFNFYFRYEWNEVDFAAWQATMIGMVRDSLGTIMGPAVISGGAVTAGTGLSISVAAFIALGDDGYLHVKNAATSNVALTAAHATLNRKDLIVARKLIVDDTVITRPTSPFDNVYLKELQKTQVVVITGTPGASPSFPAKATHDVILGGVLVNATATVPSGFDVTVAEVISGNTNFSNWLVGKDVNNTAAITGGVSATRAALVATGSNGHEGVNATGEGAASGVKGTGGATSGASGIEGVGGSTNGTGVKGTGIGSGSGGVFAGGATVGSIGVSATGSTGVKGDGSGVTGGYGVQGIGAGSAGVGVDAINLTGTALNVTGDATSPVKAAVHIDPQDTNPSSPFKGDVYVNTDGTLRYYNGSTWKTVATV